MSRNICGVLCEFCDDEPVLEEKARKITKEDAGRYFNEFEGLLVANAICPSCEAKYLAWIDERGRISYTGPGGYHVWSQFASEHDEPPFFDLSFRSTFNDEPGEADFPKYKVKVEVTRTRVGPWENS